MVKTGELTGTTVTELWVFTNAGLVQVKPTKLQKSAKIRLSFRNNDQLNVKVESGTADLVYRTPEKQFKKINISANNEINYKAPSLVAPDSSLVNSLNTAAQEVTQITKTELSVDQPTDNLSVNAPEFEVTGKLSNIGAKLLINGDIVEMEADLSFKKKIQLTDGVNLIVFQLVRSDSSVQFVRRTLRYKKE